MFLKISLSVEKKKILFFLFPSIEFLNKIRSANFQSVIRDFFKMSGKKKRGGVVGSENFFKMRTPLIGESFIEIKKNQYLK